MFIQTMFYLYIKAIVWVQFLINTVDSGLCEFLHYVSSVWFTSAVNNIGNIATTEESI